MIKYYRTILMIMLALVVIMILMMSVTMSSVRIKQCARLHDACEAIGVAAPVSLNVLDIFLHLLSHLQ